MTTPDPTESASAVSGGGGATSPPSLGDLAARASREAEQLARELAEIELLATQARTEAGRHEEKRVQAADRLRALAAQLGGGGPGGRETPSTELLEANAQLVTLTRRAGVMEAQVDVLEGKQKTLTRYRAAVESYAAALEALAAAAPGLSGGWTAPGADDDQQGGDASSVSRAILTAQEDLRRDIARAMHDGPAQSLTNIVLQAQIVERLLTRNPDAAGVELRQLVSMVQGTLEATKAFIFDVRPMVLDDLGLVPTLRRTARDRSRRAQVPVEFESLGADRRLPMDLESGLFRILDEAVDAFLSARPDRVSVRIDWGDRIEARVSAHRDAPQEPAGGASPEAEAPAVRAGDGKRSGRGGRVEEEMPAALAAMIAERRREAADAARAAGAISLPPAAWREIRQRAAMLGVRVELAEGGRTLRLELDAPPDE